MNFKSIKIKSFIENKCRKLVNSVIGYIDITFSKCNFVIQEERVAFQVFSVLLVIGLLILLFSNAAYAGSGGTEFESVWNTLKGWIQGTLGRVICGIMVLVGIIAGVARQSLIAFALGVGGAIGLYNLPLILESVLSATASVEIINII